MKSQQRGDHKNQGKSKAGKGKGKGKKILEEERPTKPVQKLWYEALSPEGYTYYWNIETNGEYVCIQSFSCGNNLPFISRINLCQLSLRRMYFLRGRIRLGSARGGIHDICGTARRGERASASRRIVEAIGRGTSDYKRGYSRRKTGECRKRKDEGIEEDT